MSFLFSCCYNYNLPPPRFQSELFKFMLKSQSAIHSPFPFFCVPAYPAQFQGSLHPFNTSRIFSTVSWQAVRSISISFCTGTSVFSRFTARTFFSAPRDSIGMLFIQSGFVSAGYLQAMYQHREYLKQEHPAWYSSLILTGKLWTYLADLNEQAEERLDLIIRQMKTAVGATEEMKARNQPEWAGRMNKSATGRKKS